MISVARFCNRPERFHTLLAAFLTVLSIATGTPASALASEASDAAMVLVQQRQLGGGMTALAEAVAKKTVTYASIEKSVGASKAQSLLSAELGKLQSKYQPQWNQNLAQTYAEIFSADELRSLTTDGRSSKVFVKLTEKQNDIGRSVRARSSDLLKSFVSEALSAALSQASARS